MGSCGAYRARYVAYHPYPARKPTEEPAISARAPRAGEGVLGRVAGLAQPSNFSPPA